MMSSEHPKRRVTAKMLGAATLALLSFGASACSSSGSSSSNASTTTKKSGDSSSGFDAAQYASLSGSLKASGSTFQQNFQNAAIGVFSKAVPGVQISYAGGGSGQGKSDLADGVVNFAGTDSLIRDEQKAKFKGNVLYFPIVVAPITVSYNLPETASLKLDGPTLAKIFEAKITSWDDPAIAALNKGAKLPTTPITVCRRADASGTTTNFTKFLEATGGADWTLGSSDTVAWPDSTQGAPGNGGVAQCIDGKAGAVGYVDFSDAKAQKLHFAAIKNAAGAFVAPSLAGATKAAGAAQVNDDLTFNPINTSGADSYPITSPTWMILMEKQSDAKVAKALKAYLTFILTDGQDATFVDSLNYAPLPATLRTKALAQVDKIQAS